MTTTTHPKLVELRALLDARRPGQPRLPYENEILDLLRGLATIESPEASEAVRIRLISRELSVAVAIENEAGTDETVLMGARRLLSVLEPDDEGDLRRAIEKLEERIDLAAQSHLD